DDDEHEPTGVNKENVNANIAGSDATVTRYEMPHLNSQYDYICHTLENGEVNYTIQYDRYKHHPVWVAYVYDMKSAMKNAPTRTDAWDGDPYYDNDKANQVATNTFPGYTRGHLCGSAERYYSEEANMQTFYMTNMSPQLYAFNGIYWGAVEDLARNWGRNVTNSTSEYYNGTLYIAKGGTIDKEENIIKYINVKNTLGTTITMPVPKYYWMACLFIASNGSARAIGFWMEHKDYGNESKDFIQQFARESACSIDELEEKTGLDFFCNLNDNVENLLEAKYDISSWEGL
nr:DNA/RNA non-specific endonuclease [Bacteroidaceae bacterium]